MAEAIEIRTLQDILDKVPAGSIEAFAKDLVKWYAVTININAMKNMFTAGVIQHDTGVIKWIDDGENNANLTIQITK